MSYRSCARGCGGCAPPVLNLCPVSSAVTTLVPFSSTSTPVQFDAGVAAVPVMTGVQFAVTCLCTTNVTFTFTGTLKYVGEYADANLALNFEFFNVLTASSPTTPIPVGASPQATLSAGSMTTVPISATATVPLRAGTYVVAPVLTQVSANGYTPVTAGGVLEVGVAGALVITQQKTTQ
jgi:hypothetical protein